MSTIKTREYGSIPWIVAAPHDKSMLEAAGKGPFDTAEAYCARCMAEVNESRERRGLPPITL